jgi:hypothetical protein
MKHLNQLVCVALVLSCLHAFRSYMHATPATPEQKLKISNGTDWQVTVRYTTPAGVVTSDTVAANGAPITISFNPNQDVSYSLEKEQGKTKTATHKVPEASLKQSVFEVTPASIKELVTATAPAPVAAPAATAAPAHAPTPVTK